MSYLRCNYQQAQPETMKYLGICLLGLFLAIPLPAIAQSSTPVTDLHGANGTEPNIKQWYDMMMMKMRGQDPFSGSNSNSSSPSTNQLELRSAPASPPGNSAPARTFTPPDRGAPGITGGAGTRFLKPWSSPKNFRLPPLLTQSSKLKTC